MCSYVATAYVAIILQSRKSLEILSSHSLRLLVDSQLFSTFDCLVSGRGGTSAPDQKVFLIGLLSHPNFPKWLRTSFFKTPLESLGFLIYPWKFQTKHSLTPRNSTKLCYTLQKFRDLKPRSLEILHDFFLIRPANTKVWCWCFPVNVNIDILFFDVYIKGASTENFRHA